MITAEERKAICEAREFKDELLQGIVDYTVTRMKNNPYCRRILEGANYQEFASSPRRPDYFDENHFYLERVYVGHNSGIWKEFMSAIIVVVPVDIAPRK